MAVLRAIVTIICAIILAILLYFVILWGLNAYRVSTTDTTVATVCDVNHHHVFTDDGVLNVNGNIRNSLQPGQTYAFYTWKNFPWEYRTIIGARPVGAPGTTGTTGSMCGSNDDNRMPPQQQQPPQQQFPQQPPPPPGYN